MPATDAASLSAQFFTGRLATDGIGGLVAASDLAAADMGPPGSGLHPPDHPDAVFEDHGADKPDNYWRAGSCRKTKQNAGNCMVRFFVVCPVCPVCPVFDQVSSRRTIDFESPTRGRPASRLIPSSWNARRR